MDGGAGGELRVVKPTPETCGSNPADQPILADLLPNQTDLTRHGSKVCYTNGDLRQEPLYSATTYEGTRVLLSRDSLSIEVSGGLDEICAIAPPGSKDIPGQAKIKSGDEL